MHGVAALLFLQETFAVARLALECVRVFFGRRFGLFVVHILVVAVVVAAAASDTPAAAVVAGVVAVDAGGLGAVSVSAGTFLLALSVAFAVALVALAVAVVVAAGPVFAGPMAAG